MGVESSGAPVAAMAGSMILAFGIVMLLLVVSLWKVFAKAGQPGWAAIVPLYNIIVMLEVAKKPLWWFVLYIIPFANVVAVVMVTHAISKNFGKGVGFTVGLIVLPFVFWPILAFGSSSYAAAEAVPSPAPQPA
jgi:ABC-type sulfate transport system permease subunit